MQDLEHWLRQDLNWYAVYHSDSGLPHVHLIVSGTGKDRETGSARRVVFKAQDLAYISERARAYSNYEYFLLLTEKLDELNLCDAISNDLLIYRLNIMK
jgi:hypothetical protein